MPQIIIDPWQIPSEVATSEPVSLLTPLPPKARKHGFVPDLRRCEAGDLILSHSVSPSPTFFERQIVRAQTQAGLSKEDSRWTHAAVFLYQDFVLEAVPWKGVITRSLYSDIPDSVLRVRRRRPKLEDKEGFKIEGYKIALCAQRMLGTRYGISAALSLGWRSIFTRMWNRDWRPFFKAAVICSQVVYDAHAEITLGLLQGCPLRDVMPAHLSATSSLEDICVPWVKLA
jgi:hypothetical protein